MLTPTQSQEAAALTAKARCEETAKAIAGLVVNDYIDQQTQGEESSVTLLEGYKWDAIELAANQLNDAGYAVEWGYARNGKQLDRMQRAIKISSREHFIQMKAVEIGAGADLGMIAALGCILIGISTKWFLIPAGLLTLNWLVSLKTRGEKRYRLRAQMLAQEWTAIACQSQFTAIKI
jgi:hypothetical protein